MAWCRVDIVIGIGLAVIGLTLLVIAHESGHYLVAKAFGMRVLKYSIGFGKTIFKHKPEDSPTTFQVAAIPFLAYVEIDGMNPFEDYDEEDPALYQNKSMFARAMTTLAGPVANYLVAIALAFVIGILGWPQRMVSMIDPEHPGAKIQMQEMRVGGVMKDSPADKAGILPGDVFIEANGSKIKDIEDLIKMTATQAGKPTKYVLKRGDKPLEPMLITPNDVKGVGKIGVAPFIEQTFVKMNLIESAKAAVVYPYKITLFQIKALTSMVKKRTTKGLGGPVAMVQGLSQAAKMGVSDFLTAIMLLSVALGFFNLLPFPALDGGRLMFLGFEAVTRKRPNEKVEAISHVIGFVILISLITFVTFRDVKNWRKSGEAEQSQSEKLSDK